MPFTDKFIITPRYIPAQSKRRSGRAISKVRFLVAHDTGNKNSTAANNVAYYIRSMNDIKASAHLFVDDREIIECIPALTAQPEKAWHVLYGVPKDDELYGADANDAAIGVEYCYGTSIDADKAYAKYIWVLAKLCDTFGLNPSKDIVGHFFLDPQRKTDPVTGLAHSRRTYEQLLKDVVTEYNTCRNVPPPAIAVTATSGLATTTVKLNVRSRPDTKAAIAQTLQPRTDIRYTGMVGNGELVNNNPVWYKDANGNYFWSGGVILKTEAPAADFFDTAINSQPLLAAPPSIPHDMPLGKQKTMDCTIWMKEHFGSRINAAVANTPFDADLIYAIACQETAQRWSLWINGFAPEVVLQRCVFDASGDFPDTSRSAFPKNKAALIAEFGNDITDMLVAEANKMRAMPQPGNPDGYGPGAYLYKGYGIFQYDLQHIKTDKDFFVNKQWYSIDKCIEKVLLELTRKLAAHPGNFFETVRAYNGSGMRAIDYAWKVSQFYTWVRGA